MCLLLPVPKGTARGCGRSSTTASTLTLQPRAQYPRAARPPPCPQGWLRRWVFRAGHGRLQFSSVAQPYPTLRPHGLQHTRSPCPSPTPGVYPLMSIESVMPSSHLILWGAWGCLIYLAPPPLGSCKTVWGAQTLEHGKKFWPLILCLSTIWPWVHYWIYMNLNFFILKTYLQRQL